MRSYQLKCTRTHRHPEVKSAWAEPVLSMGTRREASVTHGFANLHNGVFFCSAVCTHRAHAVHASRATDSGGSNLSRQSVEPRAVSGRVTASLAAFVTERHASDFVTFGANSSPRSLCLPVSPLSTLKTVFLPHCLSRARPRRLQGLRAWCFVEVPRRASCECRQLHGVRGGQAR